MKNEGLQCTYRSAVNILPLVTALAFLAATLYATVRLKDIRLAIVAVIAFLCTMYLGLRILNERIVLTEEKLIIYSLWNKKTEYDMKDITKIAVANRSRTKYIKVYFGDKKVLVRKDIKDYDLLLKTICERLHITGYTRGGISEFKMR